MVSENGDVLHGPRVLEAASQSVHQFQTIPTHANASGRIEVESRLNELKGQMRDAVRADFHKPGQLSKEHTQCALRQLDLSAACRGLPYATLLSDSRSNLDYVCVVDISRSLPCTQTSSKSATIWILPCTRTEPVSR